MPLPKKTSSLTGNTGNTSAQNPTTPAATPVTAAAPPATNTAAAPPATPKKARSRAGKEKPPQEAPQTAADPNDNASGGENGGEATATPAMTPSAFTSALADAKTTGGLALPASFGMKSEEKTDEHVATNPVATVPTTAPTATTPTATPATTAMPAAPVTATVTAPVVTPVATNTTPAITSTKSESPKRRPIMAVEYRPEIDQESNSGLRGCALWTVVILAAFLLAAWVAYPYLYQLWSQATGFFESPIVEEVLPRSTPQQEEPIVAPAAGVDPSTVTSSQACISRLTLPEELANAPWNMEERKNLNCGVDVVCPPNINYREREFMENGSRRLNLQDCWTPGR